MVLRATIGGLVVAAAAATINDTTTHTFLSIGDWGGASINEHAQATHAVAAALEKVATATSPQLVVNTGDNFYWCGLVDAQDKQVQTDWVDTYTTPALKHLPWYNSLGNHEYGYNVSAQIALADAYPTWILPARYYAKRVEIGSTGSYMSLIVLDTTPCTAAYRSDDPKEWDPCSTEFPTCSLNDGNDDFEGKCDFHANVATQDCQAQFAWFQKALAAVPAEDWLVVVGHSPADDVDVVDIVGAMQTRGFDLYLNGHVHTLTQYTVDGAGAYVTTGAGSMVATHDQDQGTVPEKRNGGDPVADGGRHSYKTVWNSKVAGFTLHTFSADLKELTTDFYSYTGAVVHSFTVTKRGA